LNGREMRELRLHRRESPSSPFVFASERGAPLSAPAFPFWWSGQLSRQIQASKLMSTCCDMPQYSGHDTLYRAGAAAV
jgi:hypothetical protein